MNAEDLESDISVWSQKDQSLFRIAKDIEDIVCSNTDIKVWNLSLAQSLK